MSETIGNGPSVFPKDFFRTVIEPGDEREAVHDVGLHENDRALVKAVGEEVPRPEVGMVANILGSTRFLGVAIGWELD